MNNDFEIVNSTRNVPSSQQKENKQPDVTTNSHMGDAIAENFDHILNLAADIVEIEKMKVQSQAVLKQMEESRKNLLAEAEAYAAKKNADTNEVIQKMQMVRDMMRDFYQYNNNANLSGEDFSRIISSIVTQMGRV